MNEPTIALNTGRAARHGLQRCAFMRVACEAVAAGLALLPAEAQLDDALGDVGCGGHGCRKAALLGPELTELGFEGRHVRTPVALGCGHGGSNRPATANTRTVSTRRARRTRSPRAPETEAREQLGRAAAASKVSLAQGLEASAAKGQPISAKFEMEGGKLQLSIYTAKAGKFSEIVVDHDTGKIAGTEAITGGEDLEAAQKQSQAMKSTKATLASAVKKAEKENAGYEAISVEASSDGGKAVAMVTLVKGEDVKTAREPL